MFKQNDVDSWFKGLETSFNSLDKSIRGAEENLVLHLKQRTDSTTPTDTKALIRSRRFDEQHTDKKYVLEVSYNKDGSAPYAVTQHDDPFYNHDFEHNTSEVRGMSYESLRYLSKPLMDEREAWWKKTFAKVGWK